MTLPKHVAPKARPQKNMIAMFPNISTFSSCVIVMLLTRTVKAQQALDTEPRDHNATVRSLHRARDWSIGGLAWPDVSFQCVLAGLGAFHENLDSPWLRTHPRTRVERTQHIIGGSACAATRPNSQQGHQMPLSTASAKLLVFCRVAAILAALLSKPRRRRVAARL